MFATSCALTVPATDSDRPSSPLIKPSSSLKPAPGARPAPSPRTMEMPSDIQNMILDPKSAYGLHAAWHKLNVRGVGELLTLGTVNKAFRRSVDQLLLAVMKRETPSSLRFQENANHQAEHWIALGCVSFVREAKIRKEPHSNVYVRSFLYTVAHQMSLERWSQDWNSKDQAKRVAARDAFVRIATSRLAPGGQSLLPELSEEEIRKTLNLAMKSRR
jgi:hypothetical protein